MGTWLSYSVFWSMYPTFNCVGLRAFATCVDYRPGINGAYEYFIKDLSGLEALAALERLLA